MLIQVYYYYLDGAVNINPSIIKKNVKYLSKLPILVNNCIIIILIVRHVNKKVKKISGANETKEEDEKEEDSMDILNKNIHFLTNLSYLSFSSIIIIII